MKAHTLTVRFDDEKTSLDALKAGLFTAGYAVPSSAQAPSTDQGTD
jgi:hypothetical protein